MTSNIESLEAIANIHSIMYPYGYMALLLVIIITAGLMLWQKKERLP